MAISFMVINRDKLSEWCWLSDKNIYYAFTRMLFRANYERRQWRYVQVERGQLVCGIDAYAAELGFSTQSFRTILKKLKKSGDIEIKSTNKFTIITICNYESWVCSNGCITNKTNELTNKQLTNNQQTTNNNKIKELTKQIELLTKEKEELAKASKKKENEDSVLELKEQFDKFRVKYRQYGGNVRGLETELDNLKKHHKDWKEIIPLLLGALDKENKERQNAKAKGVFFPLMKNLQTYINNRSWESYSYEQSAFSTKIYMPIADGVYQRWNSARNCLEVNSPYFNMWNDGYNEDSRPDGAMVAYHQYMWKWDSKTKQWVEQNND